MGPLESGRHGTPKIRTGQEMIREGKKWKKDDPRREAWIKKGQQMKQKGNSINHKGGGKGGKK